MKSTKTKIWILIFTILYIIFFAFHFFLRGNFEFVWYIFILIALTILVILLDKKYNFSTLTIFGISLWGLGHMFGGSTLLTEERLYRQVLIPIFTTEEVTIISYDHLMHFYFYVVATFMIYQVIKKYIKEDAHWIPVAVLIVFASMGVGALNEIFEFLPVLFLKETGVGGYFNVAWDIVFNALGTLTAIIYISLRIND